MPRYGRVKRFKVEVQQTDRGVTTNMNTKEYYEGGRTTVRGGCGDDRGQDESCHGHFG